MKSRYDVSRFRFAGFGLLALLVICSVLPQLAHSQGRGIPTEGREFFIGYMPPAQQRFETRYYVLIGSYNAQNVTISYFDKTGREQTGKQVPVGALSVTQVELNRQAMRPTYPGEIEEYKAARIKSKYPISVQIYAEGSLAGGMTLALPTAGLGNNYVVSAWNDNPTIPNALQSGWKGQNLKDSSCSEFMIIAPYNNTVVTFTPNSTTFAGVIGVNSGYRHDGTQHPQTITLQRGQVYWVRSNPGDAEWDLSGTVIKASKPVAVLAGHEKALLGDPSGIWTWLDNDFRDMMLEQMIPVEAWETGGYVSIPFEPPLRQSNRMLKNGEGDLYRMYTPYPEGGNAHLYQGGRISPYEYQLSQFQIPVAQRENVIEDGVQVFESQGKKINVVMYDYFQGIHDQDPGANASGKGGKTQGGGGGSKPLESTNFTTPNEMNVIPISRWRTSTLFKVPNQSEYRGGTFMNLITHRDSLGVVEVMINRASPKPLSALPSRRKFNIPGYPELVGIRFQLTPGDYFLNGNTPFVVYSYGRTENFYKDDYGYASPTAAALGSRDEPYKPRAEIIPNCASWDVKIFDSRPDDKGIAEIILLDDPYGIYTKPGKQSVNVRLVPDEPQFVVGDSVVRFSIKVSNPFKDAYGALYVVDRAGNDTVYEFTYRAPSFAAAPDSIDFGALPIGVERCSTFTFTNTATAGGKPVMVEDIRLLFRNQGVTIKSVSSTLPRALAAGESITVTVCFNPSDANVLHVDSLYMKTDCFEATLAVLGIGQAPDILAEDLDFGLVAPDSTRCLPLKVWNIGSAPFILTKDWVLKNIDEFSFEDDAKLPVTIEPGKFVELTFCYKPKAIGLDSTSQDWGHNIDTRYFSDRTKPWSSLKGEARAPELVWDRPTQEFTTVCDDADTVRVNLTNILNAPDVLTDVVIIGRDASEFKLGGNEHNWPVPTGGVPIEKPDTVWFDLIFKADLSKGYTTREAQLVAITKFGPDPKIDLLGHVVYADMKTSVSTLDFGPQPKDTKVKQSIRVTNPGTADLQIKSYTIDQPGFIVESGLAVGQVIFPGGWTDVVIEATAPPSGTRTANLTILGETNCPPPQTVVMSIMGYEPRAAGTGFGAPATFVCRDNVGTVTFTNTGTIATGGVPLRLEKVEIVDAPGSTQADQFSFADGSRLMTLNVTVDPEESRTFDVRYVPTGVSTAQAVIRYYWFHDGSSASGIVENTLSGSSLVLENTLSVAKDDGTMYTAKANERFTVDVKMLDDIIDMANINRVEFGLSFRQDLFAFRTADAGAGYSATFTPQDKVDSDWDTVWVNVSGDFLQKSLIVSLPFELRLSRDVISDFIIVNPVMYDDRGVACYMTIDTIPAKFVPIDYCGDKTIRDYLNNQLPGTIRRISPNPAHEDVTVVLDVHVLHTPINFELYDMLGRKVYDAVVEPKALGRIEHTIDSFDLPSGTYTLRVAGNGRVDSRTIKLQH